MTAPHPPVLSIEAAPVSPDDRDRLLSGLKALQAEDPFLIAETPIPLTGPVIIFGSGELQLEIIITRLTTEFDAQARFGPQRVLYRETITKPGEGESKYTARTAGGGEYGHVKVRVYPAEPGAGCRFDDEILGGAIPKSFIPAVRAGIDQALAHGILAGYSMVDVVVALCDGSYHEVDSSESAFQVAAALACGDALRRAAPVLLGPWMRVEVAVPREYADEIVDNLKARHARFVSEGVRGPMALISALAPLSEMLGYATWLRQLTAGHGSVAMSFIKYDIVHEANEPGDSWAAPVTAPLRPAPKTRDAREAVAEPEEDRLES